MRDYLFDRMILFCGEKKTFQIPCQNNFISGRWHQVTEGRANLSAELTLHEHVVKQQLKFSADGWKEGQKESFFKLYLHNNRVWPNSFCLGGVQFAHWGGILEGLGYWHVEKGEAGCYSSTEGSAREMSNPTIPWYPWKEVLLLCLPLFNLVAFRDNCSGTERWDLESGALISQSFLLLQAAE